MLLILQQLILRYIVTHPFPYKVINRRKPRLIILKQISDLLDSNLCISIVNCKWWILSYQIASPVPTLHGNMLGQFVIHVTKRHGPIQIIALKAIETKRPHSDEFMALAEHNSFRANIPPRIINKQFVMAYVDRNGACQDPRRPDKSTAEWVLSAGHL